MNERTAKLLFQVSGLDPTNIDDVRELRDDIYRKETQAEINMRETEDMRSKERMKSSSGYDPGEIERYMQNIRYELEKSRPPTQAEINESERPLPQWVRNMLRVDD